jgi:hypothetical protein
VKLVLRRDGVELIIDEPVPVQVVYDLPPEAFTAIFAGR